MLFVTTNAFAGPIRSYVGASAGFILPNDSSVTDINGATADVSYNPGLSLSGYVGHEFGTGLRLEGEVNYNKAELDKIITTGNVNKLNSELWSIGLFANAYYDFIISKTFIPYIGVGLGFKNVNISSADVNGTRLWNSDRDNVFAYQVGLGNGLRLSKNMTFDLGYRYQGTGNFKIDQVSSDLSSHNILFGLRYYSF